MPEHGNLLVYEIEIETIFFCKMNFEAYPFDENICYFTLGSYSYLEQSGLNFRLFKQLKHRQPIQFNASKQVAQLDFAIDVKELPEDMEKSWDGYGIYQRTGFEIKFQRKFLTYIGNYYIPSGILVVLSWVSD